MDKLTRQQLKTDKFALEVEHGVEYVAEHKKQVTRYGAIAAVVLVAIIATWSFMKYRNGVREDALRNAVKLLDAQVNAPASEAVPSFPSEAEKSKAVQKALTEVADQYPGTEQGSIAKYFLGTGAADRGDMASAEKNLRAVAEDGPKNYAALAKMALAPILKSQGKAAEGEKLLRDLVNNPTLFVSKEYATIVLSQYLSSTNPAEARKLLEPLRTERGSISRAALSALAEIPQK